MNETLKIKNKDGIPKNNHMIQSISKWSGDYLTEDELYKYYSEDLNLKSETLIDKIEELIRKNIVLNDNFSYYEKELVIIFLLLKTKEKQPKTITINSSLVVPIERSFFR